MLLGHLDRLAPCCPWFNWAEEDLSACIANPKCNFGGIETGCTMTAHDLSVFASAVPDFANLCQAPTTQTCPPVFAQFADGQKNDFTVDTLDKRSSVQAFEPTFKPISTNVGWVVEYQQRTTALQSGGADDLNQEVALYRTETDIRSALAAAFCLTTQQPLLKCNCRRWFRCKSSGVVLQNSRISPADPCWQRANPALYFSNGNKAIP